MIEKLRGYTEEVSGALLDKALRLRDFDFLDSYATPLPQTLITELMGVSNEQRGLYYELTEDIENSLGKYMGSPVSAEQFALARKAYNTLCVVFDQIFEDRRKNPRNDFITGLVQSQAPLARRSTCHPPSSFAR